MKTIAAMGLTAGVNLRSAEGSVEFTHHWMFVIAQSLINS
jgi:hypothetical protein